MHNTYEQNILLRPCFTLVCTIAPCNASNHSLLTWVIIYLRRRRVAFVTVSVYTFAHGVFIFIRLNVPYLIVKRLQVALTAPELVPRERDNLSKSA